MFRRWMTLGLAAAGLGWAASEALARRRTVDLAGWVALVTGGSRGFGLLLARELGRQGCRVAICARDPQELERARAALAAEGITVVSAVCDVSDRAQVGRLVEEVRRALGPVDVLVNNAGIIQVGPVDAMTEADFRQAMDVMYWGMVYPALAVLPEMRARRRGRIVNITSIGGKVAVPHLLPYTAAKFAAVGFSEGLRAELSDSGVLVTTIAPGLMRTGSYLNALFKGQQEQEYTWFALGAALPLVSMDAERAARQVVRALQRGEAERVLTVPATLLARFQGLFPGTTAEVLGLINRFILPPPALGATGAARGRELEARAPSRMRQVLTTLGRSAFRRFQEPTGPRTGAEQGAPPVERAPGSVSVAGP